MKKSEFEQLQPGQMIQHKKDNKWAFIVHQNFGERITAIRCIEIRDPEEWDVVTDIANIKDEVVVQIYEIPINDAAHELHGLLKGQPWFSTVGIGNNELFIYTSKKKYPKDFTEFRGITVKYKYFGKIAPLG